MFINCFKEPIDVLMRVLLSRNDHEELNHVDGHRNDVKQEDGLVEDVKEVESRSHVATLTLKSSLRKVNLDSTEAKKKKVQWVDAMGKELVEIREFESSEEDDMDSDQQKKCVCVIL